MAARHGLPLIEDAAQSIGARRKIDGEWRMAGELGTRRDAVLLPQQEPRRLRRRRHDGDPGRRAGRAAAAAAAPRRRQAVLPRRGREQQPAGHAAGGGAAGQAARTWRAGAQARARNAARYTRGVRGPSGRSARPAIDPANEHIFQPVHHPGAAPGRAAGAPQGEGDRQRRSIIRCRCTSSRASRISATPRGVFRCRRPRRSRCSRCRSTPS